MAKKSYTFTTEKEFKGIKLLQQAGLRPSQIKEISGRSAGTIANMLKSDTFADYKEIVHAYINKRPANLDKNIEAVTAPTHSPEPTKPEVRTQFSSDSVNLDRIATALERLADAWEAQPKKTGFFS